jgi:L-cysteine/cystine lyase
VLGFPAEHQLAWALAALDVLEEAGLERVHEHACAQAETLAQKLVESGRVVAPRGPSTLVSWRAEDPTALVAGLGDRGFVLRDLPGTPYVRASVGAWNDDGDIDGLLSALAA